jgi:hypothetical protein
MLGAPGEACDRVVAELPVVPRRGTNAYAKLGIRSRTELAVYLDTE